MSETVGQFGVNGPEARRDWPALEQAEAAAVIAHFPLPAAQAVVWHGQRPFSASGLVRLLDGSLVFLKRHDRRLRDESAIIEEHRFITHLLSNGQPVSRPVRMADGSSVLCQGGWVYEVFLPMPGLDLYCQTQSWEPFHTVAQAIAAGRALGALHRAAEGFRAPARLSRRLLLSTFEAVTCPDLTDGLKRWIPHQAGLAEALAHRPWQHDVAECILPFHDRLHPHLGLIQPGWGHGDWHGSNLFWTDRSGQAQVCGIFDFGMADRTCAAYDLAVAIERNMIAWLTLDDGAPVSYGQLAAFLRAYQEERCLSADERRLVPLFLPLVHVEFALSEVAYYSALVHDPASAEVAYTDYLLGHARWFDSAAGQHLLERLPALLTA
ncbi:phosphotransferase enzyme family protein [Gluconobacter morbifer]|uniref:Aminoglycoside phosphotransferase domain-containing protein n=1 Tax=Gluconobacter morbifer G707 TaxID=1088869 RepID=G6XJ87_9PROT|nr:phosphotransferase [Gluconobacter morbifer]EHH68203.1 hypothetical protein GMO_15530 [Gluconobacter morbifer G707]